MPTIRDGYGKLFSKVIILLTDLKNAYLHIPNLHFVWQNKPYGWKVLPFGLATAPRVLTYLINPYCSFLNASFFVLYL